MDWKYAELARYVRTAPRVSGNGYYFRTITHPELAKLRESFYIGNKKIVPIKMLASTLTEFALAVWIMDDGAADGKQLRINTQSFSVEEAEDLASLIRAKFGVVMTVNMDKNRPRLRCNAASMGRAWSGWLEYTRCQICYTNSPCNDFSFTDEGWTCYALCA